MFIEDVRDAVALKIEVYEQDERDVLQTMDHTPRRARRLEEVRIARQELEGVLTLLEVACRHADDEGRVDEFIDKRREALRR